MTWFYTFSSTNNVILGILIFGMIACAVWLITHVTDCCKSRKSRTEKTEPRLAPTHQQEHTHD